MFPDALFDVSVTLPPAQNVVAPLVVIVGVAGLEFTETIVAADAAEQPLLLVMVTL